MDMTGKAYEHFTPVVRAPKCILLTFTREVDFTPSAVIMTVNFSCRIADVIGKCVAIVALIDSVRDVFARCDDERDTGIGDRCRVVTGEVCGALERTFTA